MKGTDDDGSAHPVPNAHVPESPAHPAKTPHVRNVSRGTAVVVLVLLGSLLLPVALLAGWARSTITETEGYVSAVTDLAHDERVQAALIDELTSAVLTQIDVDSLVDSAVSALRRSDDPEAGRLQILGPAMRYGIESLANSIVTRIVRSDQFTRIWIQANTSAHQGLNVVLRGTGSTAIDLAADGQVSLNLRPILDLVRTELAARDIPMPPALVPVDAQIPLFSSPELVKVRAYYALLDRAATWLPWLVLALLVSAVGLARARAGALAWIGSLTLATTGAVTLGIHVLHSSYLSGLTGSALRNEVTVRVAALLADSMTTAVRVGFVVGLATLVAAVIVAQWHRIRTAYGR